MFSVITQDILHKIGQNIYLPVKMQI